MLKKFVIVLFCFAIIFGCFEGMVSLGWSDEIAAVSKISGVTVYPGSSRITRQAVLDVPSGSHSVVFENIVPNFDENTLTVTGQGTTALKIFGAYIKREYFTDPADQRVRDLEAKIQNLDDLIQVENNNLEILRKEKEFLDSVKLYSGQQIPKDLVTAMPTVEDLEGLREFLSGRFLDVANKGESVKVKLRDLGKERVVLEQTLNELRGVGGDEQRQLVVDVECAKAGKITLEVSYLVQGANWRPVYDARAQYDRSEVELTSFAMIKQTTGEDWTDVPLTLSTAQPAVSGRMPFVDPWILQFETPQPMGRGKGLYHAQEMAMSAPSDDYLRADMTVTSSEEVMERAELAYSQVAQKGVSMVYKIPRSVNVKSDGSENKYPISSQILKADFEYSSYPRVTSQAYLGSRVVNSNELQLLAGEVNLFLDGDYVGKSSIDNIGPGEEFDLYLGIDENVKVKRDQIARKVDDVLIGGLKSPNRATTVTYKLTVENYKGKDITVHLFEAIPVSQNERIKVKTFDVSPKPTDVNWKDREGVWRWQFGLKPKAKQEIIYSFSVDHPRELRVPGI